MRKILFSLLLAAVTSVCAMAQKVVHVDTEYILKNIPAYETANEQLNELSKKYEAEVKAKLTEVEQLYETYRTESVFLSNEMKTSKENEIIQKEQDAKKLQQQYFGQNGELFKQARSPHQAYSGADFQRYSFPCAREELFRGLGQGLSLRPHVFR